MIKYKIGNVTTKVTLKKFKDGCVNPNIQSGSIPVDCNKVMILVTVQFGGEYSVNDLLFALAQTCDALRYQYPNSDINLRMPYIPYARQDRACNNGEAFGLKRLGRFINDLDFQTVSVLDPHSTVANGVIDRMYAIPQKDIFGGIKTSWATTYIVAPDQGALKKCEEFAKAVNAAGVVSCVKNRNQATMEIEGLRIMDYIPNGADVLVLDDLIDGGRSFIEVSRQIRSQFKVIGSLELACTHGLFTFGTEVVADQFDKVYTTNSYLSNKENPKVQVINSI